MKKLFMILLAVNSTNSHYLFPADERKENEKQGETRAVRKN